MKYDKILTIIESRWQSLGCSWHCFFYFTGCLTIFIIVNDDNNNEVIFRRETLWDKVGLPTMRPPCGLGEGGLAGGEPCSAGRNQLWRAHPSCSPHDSAGHSEAFSQAPRALRRAVGECSAARMHCPTDFSWQPGGGSHCLGYEFPGKQGKLDSFTIKTPCWIFVLGALGLWNITTPMYDHSLKKYYSLEHGTT